MSAGQPPIDSSEIRRLTPVLGPGYTFGSVTDKISSIVLTRPTSFGWYMGFLIAFGLTGLMTVAIGWLFTKGTGIWGINIPIGWGFAIVNFVWWIGICHAGTLISAILFLLNQKWRTSINRFAGHSKERHGFGKSVDRGAPFLIQEEQDGGDERPGVADTDPPDEIHDGEAPADGDVDAPDARALGEQPADGEGQQASEAEGNQKTHVPAEGSRARENNGADLVGDRPESVARA